MGDGERTRESWQADAATPPTLDGAKTEVPAGCATLLTAAGVAPRVIVETLGHSRISITMDLYTHVVVPDTQREATSHMDRCRQMVPSKWPGP